MTKRKTRLGRDLRNNPAIFQDVLESLDLGMSTCIRTSDRHNAVYGTGEFNACMVHACASNGQVAGCAESAKGLAEGARAFRGRRPTGEWLRATANGCTEAGIWESFESMVAGQLEWLRRNGMVRRGALSDVAVDMHLIPRYDKKYGAELVRSKTKSGTYVFERYVTIQCLVRGSRLVLGVLRMPALESVSTFVRKIVDFARRAGIGTGTVMMDREFFATDVMLELDALGVSYLVPCKNTDAVVDAIDEFAAGARGRVSAAAITTAPGRRAARYTMIITGRKKLRKKRRRQKLAPSERYIAFATNNPGLDPDEYSRRWGIETGYRMIENARAKTHSKNPAVRLLCFVFSAAVYNSWVMANAMLARRHNVSAEEPLITQQQVKDALLFLAVPVDHRQVSKPPPSGLA